MKTTQEESGICKVCKGVGILQYEREVSGEVEIFTEYCEACAGTGLEPSDGDVD
jgi:DnaJ-class molecular chaperone